MGNIESVLGNLEYLYGIWVIKSDVANLPLVFRFCGANARQCFTMSYITTNIIGVPGKFYAQVEGANFGIKGEYTLQKDGLHLEIQSTEGDLPSHTIGGDGDVKKTGLGGEYLIQKIEEYQRMKIGEVAEKNGKSIEEVERKGINWSRYLAQDELAKMGSQVGFWRKGAVLLFTVDHATNNQVAVTLQRVTVPVVAPSESGAPSSTTSESQSPTNTGASASRLIAGNGTTFSSLGKQFPGGLNAISVEKRFINDSEKNSRISGKLSIGKTGTAETGSNSNSYLSLRSSAKEPARDLILGQGITVENQQKSQFQLERLLVFTETVTDPNSYTGATETRTSTALMENPRTAKATKHLPNAILPLPRFWEMRWYGDQPYLQRPMNTDMKRKRLSEREKELRAKSQYEEEEDGGETQSVSVSYNGVEMKNRNNENSTSVSKQAQGSSQGSGKKKSVKSSDGSNRNTTNSNSIRESAAQSVPTDSTNSTGKKKSVKKGSSVDLDLNRVSIQRQPKMKVGDVGRVTLPDGRIVEYSVPPGTEPYFVVQF